MCSKRQAQRYILTMKNTLFTFASFAATLALSTAGFAAPQVIDAELKDGSRDRTVPIKVRVPDGSGKVPLVIFSHGLGGSREGGKAWGEYWSANGYLVVHLQHPGTDDAIWRGDESERPKDKLQRALQPEQLVGRTDDVRFLISEIERSQGASAGASTNAWMTRADLTRIAMTGHSYGAHTVAALAGQRFPGPVKSLADSRIKAFIAFSPNATGLPRTYEDRYGSMRAPFLSVTGTRDGDPLSKDPYSKKAAEKRTLVFEHQPPGNAFLFVLKGADHMVFNGHNAISYREMPHLKDLPKAIAPRVEDSVRVSTLKFLDAYLRGDEKAKGWLKTEAGEFFANAGEWKSK
jgi:dienelactone hydrolase